MVKAKIDMREFHRVARQLTQQTRGASRNVIREVARKFVLNATKMTPPFSGKMGSHLSSQTWGKQRKAGMNAIKGDLLGGTRGWAGKTKRAGIFETLPERQIRYAMQNVNSDGAHYWTNKDGQVYGVESKDFNPSGDMNRMRAHHKRYFKHGKMTEAGARTRDIGRWKWVDKMVVTKKAMNDYLKRAYLKVFYAKSGWSLAARSLGLKLPAWITKHGGQGIFKASRRSGWPSYRVGNAVEYIQAAGRELRILKFALRITTQNMKKQLAMTMAKNLRRAR